MDQSIIDTYHNVEKIWYVIIAIVGVPVNLGAIVILSRGKCGLSTCTTRYLVAMAAADLLVVITGDILYQIKYHYFLWTFLSFTPVCRAIMALKVAARDCSVWFTVAFTFDRFVAICCQKVKTKFCTGKTAAAVLATVGVLFCLKNVPRYFIFVPYVIIDSVPWRCRPVASYRTDHGWVVYDYFHRVFTPIVPFIVILMLKGLTVRHILMASRVRQRLRGQSKGLDRTDPEMESRRKSVVLLFAISGSFVVLWMTSIVLFVYMKIRGPSTGPNAAAHIFVDFSYVLNNLSSCTNTFIYAITQSKFREEVKRAVIYPFTSVLRLMNKSAH